jgi:ferritin
MPNSKEKLKELLNEQLNLDDHGSYIYGRREDYVHVQKEAYEDTSDVLVEDLKESR